MILRSPDCRASARPSPRPRSGRSYAGIIHRMKVTSEKKAAAARANGAFSRGPVTPEGKARSSQNAITHGMVAKVVVLPGENEEVFIQVVQSYCDRFKPVDDVERDMVYEIAICSWRMGRAVRVERHMLAIEAGARQGSSLDRIAGAYSNLSGSTKMSANERYQSRLERVRSRLIRDFLRLRRDLPADPELAYQPDDPVPAPAPEPPSPEPPPPTQNLPNEPITPNISNPPVPPAPAPEFDFPTCQPLDPADLDSPPWRRR